LTVQVYDEQGNYFEVTTRVVTLLESPAKPKSTEAKPEVKVPTKKEHGSHDPWKPHRGK